MLGDLTAMIPGVPPLGGAADAVLKPLYTDTILAWMSVDSPQRKNNSGWSRYFEYFQDGADKAYTLSSLLVLRAGFYATKTWFTHELAISDAAPFLVGDNGLGAGAGSDMSFAPSVRSFALTNKVFIVHSREHA
ncbi:hypothetical protein, partial [Streptomyces sp. NPDC018347]|uniref:Gp37-like protein n=1 Tax=Streptomyces sp. NPDC018347 TaxID=3157193 RepID=UPI00340F3416